MHTDSIADFLTRLRNASAAHHESVTTRATRMNHALANILAAQGYIAGCEVRPNAPADELTLVLKYGQAKQPAIRGIKRLSTPGRRQYAGAGAIPRVQNGFGICIVSTSRGVLVDREARAQGVGGELLCAVW